MNNWSRMERIGLVVCIGTALLFSAGCGKKEQDVAAEKEAAPAVVEVQKEQPKPVYQAPKETVDVEVAPTRNAGKPKPVPFRVGAIIDRGNGGLSAGLVSDESGYNAMVETGDDFEGYTVEQIRAESSEVLLQRDGEMYIAGMSAGIVPEIPVMNEPMSAPQTAEEFEELMKISSTDFKPTQDEIARGIDPNDPKTWPEDYRGPGIERAGVDIEKFEPTQDELGRGIDPNDPASWPEDYRGPGIERAMLKMKDQE